MVSMACPWCEEDQRIALEILAELETRFDCDACGTAVEIADESAEELDLAA